MRTFQKMEMMLPDLSDYPVIRQRYPWFGQNGIVAELTLEA